MIESIKIRGVTWPALRKAGRLDVVSHSALGKPMRVQIQLRIITDDDTVLSEDVIACFDKGDDQLEEIGLSLDQAKTMLAGAQTSLVAAQAASFLARHRCCERCGRHLQSKGRCRILFRTAFGTIPLVSPRVYRCACQPAGSKTFSPLTSSGRLKSATHLVTAFDGILGLSVDAVEVSGML